MPEFIRSLIVERLIIKIDMNSKIEVMSTWLAFLVSLFVDLEKLKRGVLKKSIEDIGPFLILPEKVYSSLVQSSLLSCLLNLTSRIVENREDVVKLFWDADGLWFMYGYLPLLLIAFITNIKFYEKETKTSCISYIMNNGKLDGPHLKSMFYCTLPIFPMFIRIHALMWISYLFEVFSYGPIVVVDAMHAYWVQCDPSVKQDDIVKGNIYLWDETKEFAGIGERKVFPLLSLEISSVPDIIHSQNKSQETDERKFVMNSSLTVVMYPLVNSACVELSVVINNSSHTVVPLSSVLEQVYISWYKKLIMQVDNYYSKLKEESAHKKNVSVKIPCNMEKVLLELSNYLKNGLNQKYKKRMYCSVLDT
jgi:hypothetical protein